MPGPETNVYSVVVSVGTDHHPFDRLVRWAAAWSVAHPDISVFVQRGTSTAPDRVDSAAVLAHGEIRRLFAAADVVVCHGGPSTVMDARSAGRLPIVVPRDPERGEHVDGHQIRFANHLELHGLARLAGSESELAQLIDEALTQPAQFSIGRSETHAPTGIVQFGAVVDDLLGVHTPINYEPR